MLGQEPDAAPNQLFALSTIEALQSPERCAAFKAEAEQRRLPVILALDVARLGSNECVLSHRHGDVVFRLDAWGHTTADVTVGTVARFVRTLYTECEGVRWPIQALVVDEGGLGGPVIDFLNLVPELQGKVIGYHSGKPANRRKHFKDQRSELWFNVATRAKSARPTVAIVAHPKIKRDLAAPTYRILPNGQVQVETKEEMQARMLPSPDYGDSALMTFTLEPIEPPVDVMTDPNRDPNVLEAERLQREHERRTRSLAPYPVPAPPPPTPEADAGEMLGGLGGF